MYKLLLQELSWQHLNWIICTKNEEVYEAIYRKVQHQVSVNETG